MKGDKMNNTYFNKDIFPQTAYNNETIEQQKQINQKYTPTLPIQQSYIENLLKINQGKKVKIYMTFPNSEELKEFSGIIEQSGHDYIILSEPSTGKWKLLPIIFLNYITFDENINYEREFYSNN